jgi:hypothetical protein
MNRGDGDMRLNFASVALCVGFVLWLPSTPQDLPGLAGAQAGSRDALYVKCRTAVVQKYGHKRINAAGRRVISLDNKVAISAIDACVANGGRVT